MLWLVPVRTDSSGRAEMEEKECSPHPPSKLAARKTLPGLEGAEDEKERKGKLKYR